MQLTVQTAGLLAKGGSVSAKAMVWAGCQMSDNLMAD